MALIAVTQFNCPNCAAANKVVRVEADHHPADFAVGAQRFGPEYFLVGRRRRAERSDALRDKYAVSLAARTHRQRDTLILQHKDSHRWRSRVNLA
jgi:hypothetical protein